MAVADPYASCPCGSGQKLKWCCHKVEPMAEKAIRLYEGGQIEAALLALDEGLKKAPGNPWLARLKAGILIRQGRSEESIKLLEDLVAKNPALVPGWSMLIRGILEVSGPKAAAEALQKALVAVAPEARPGLFGVTQLIGAVFREVGVLPAARMHLLLALTLRGPDDEERALPLLSAIQTIAADPSESAWLRNSYQLQPAPETLNPEQAKRFADAVEAANTGRWQSAAAQFDLLAGDGVIEAERNLGLCRLWMVDVAGAAEAFQRYVRKAGETTDAVDYEALRALIQPLEDEDLVDLVQLIWTLRDRAALIAALENSDRVDHEGRVPLDPEDEDSPEVDGYAVLDRPQPSSVDTVSIHDYPLMVGRVLVGQEIVALEAFDDGRLDGLSNWFTELAGTAIPPAQPKTKEIEKLPRDEVAMQVKLWMPEGLSAKRREELHSWIQRHLIEEIWPNTPSPRLGGRTPIEAAAGADATTKVKLRAAVFQFELAAQMWRSPIDLTPLRERLGIGPEPEIDPVSVNIETVHLSRLHLIPADRLDDDRLLKLYTRCRSTSMLEALGQAARAMVERPELMAREGGRRVSVYLDLANLAVVRGDESLAASWLRRGRESDPDARANMLHWDLADVRLRSRIEPPEVWVPELAILLQQSTADRDAGLVILSTLSDMGLVQMIPNPDNPEEMLLDSQRLQALLARYGPRVTTAAGDLGISVSRGGIWTPGSGAPAGGSSTGGAIWTPGSHPPSPPASSDDAGDKPRLIIPGR